jgi:peptidoglycan hydrolase-like protein with peptidoglycan-binding domain
MIKLGTFDAGTPETARSAYLKQVEQLTRAPLADIAPGVDHLGFEPRALDSSQTMSVADVQRALVTIGFFPGGMVDGICGYRTQSAIRLFQEYVRAVERLDGVPDGRFGAGSERHLQRWLDGALRSVWTPVIAGWQSGTVDSGEYGQWLALLAQVKQQYLTAPNRALQLVNASSVASDTRKVTAWDVGPRVVHIVGIRREEQSGKFDDIFVLLMKGLVFKFQGSTEPGASDDPRGRPFLVQGQHDYHFGWHQRKYLALRPQGAGVLVVRSGHDAALDDADYARGLEPNGSINVHWGGKGLTADVKTWSEGCQVINGSVYLNPDNVLVSCASFAALNNGEIATNAAKTRGAYNVLLDLVTALGSDLTPTVKYTLLTEADLAFAPVLAQGLAGARARVTPMLSDS